MSYQVLARKWRPAKFKEMVGQEHVLKALINALDDDRLHHAYLFTGTRGVGKTSIARLFAKSLNCETGVSSEPCGQCSACKEIAEGRFVDLIEVDAASRTKVEDTRELMENVQYAPTHGRYKVYLIDEVHMLSTHSFNALLKTLEEPPPHVKFLLATTDPQKLPITILSRCLQFNLKNLIPERIVSHLIHVLGHEQIRYEEAALWLLARSADGSMRDAMSLTDQAIAFGAGEINEADVRAMLGTIDQRLVYQMLACISQGDASQLMAAVNDLAQFSPDYNTVLGDLVSVLHRIAVAQTLPDAVDNSMGDKEQIQNLAVGMSAEDVQLYYQIALMGRKDLPYVPDPREGLEMVLLRMLAFRPAGAQPRPTQLQPSSQADSQAEPQPALQPQPVFKQESQPQIEPQAQSEAQPELQTDAQPSQTLQQPQQQPNSATTSSAVSDESTPAAPIVDPVTTPPSPEAPPVYDNNMPEYDQSYTAASTDAYGVPPAKKFEAAIQTPEDIPPWETSDTASEPSVVASVQQAPVQPAPVQIPGQQGLSQQAHNQQAPVQAQRSAAEPAKQPRQKLDSSGKIFVETQVCSRDPAELQLGHWVHISRSIGLSGMTESLATHISLEQVDQGALVFHYNAEQATMLNEVQQQRISSALKDYFAAAVEVQFRQAAQQQETPAQYMARKREERQLAAIESIRNDETVQLLQQHFEAQIELSSVVPID